MNLSLLHRRYHGESKPFACLVCGVAFANPLELSRHGKCHLGMYILKNHNLFIS